MVKCAECGFLAVRNFVNRGLEEAEETFREKGYPTNIFDAEGRLRPIHEELPLCFAQRYNLRDKFKEFAGKDSPDNFSVRYVINEERECEAFTKWQLGFTPREHREMLDQKRKQESEARREHEDREWRERQEEKQRIWQEQQGYKRLRWEIIIFGVLVTLALIGGQVFAAFIQRGSLW